MMGGVAIVLTAQLWKPLLAPEVIARIAGFGKLLPVPTRLLYGGITEELLMRWALRSEEHTSELQSQSNLVCRLLLEKKKNKSRTPAPTSTCKTSCTGTPQSSETWISTSTFSPAPTGMTDRSVTRRSAASTLAPSTSC